MTITKIKDMQIGKIYRMKHKTSPDDKLEYVIPLRIENEKHIFRNQQIQRLIYSIVFQPEDEYVISEELMFAYYDVERAE